MTDIETRCMRVAQMNVIKKSRMREINRHQLRTPETSLNNEIRQYAFLDWLLRELAETGLPPSTMGSRPLARQTSEFDRTCNMKQYYYVCMARMNVRKCTTERHERKTIPDAARGRGLRTSRSLGVARAGSTCNTRISRESVLTEYSRCTHKEKRLLRIPRQRKHLRNPKSGNTRRVTHKLGKHAIITVHK